MKECLIGSIYKVKNLKKHAKKTELIIFMCKKHVNKVAREREKKYFLVSREAKQEEIYVFIGFCSAYYNFIWFICSFILPD